MELCLLDRDLQKMLVEMVENIVNICILLNCKHKTCYAM